MVTCVWGSKVVDLTRYVARLLGRAWEEPVIMVHVATSIFDKGDREVLEVKFRLLSRRLKSRFSIVSIL